MVKILDVSHHQNPNSFDWGKLKKEIDGLIIRVQYGSNLDDTKDEIFIAKAKQYGIPFGVYAYGMFVSVSDAKVEAQNFLKRGDAAARFWVLDVESDTIEACGTANLAAASQAFIDTLKAAGKKTGFYYEHRYIGLYGLDNVKADFRWLPRYGSNDGTKQTKYKPAIPCDLWQYTSEGTAGGVKPLDLSDLNGSKTLDWFFSTNSFDNPATPTSSFAGKKLVSKVNQLRFYSSPSWADKDVYGTVTKGLGFPVVLAKVDVSGSPQYKVQNSKGKTFYVTASNTYVELVNK
ncbi:hypothetical protein HB884_05810 [Listeria booriae]|uniref:GH25 family lysozyme n=1 Tax=Listeria booriae TaxID=1552123 RepID=UPI001624C8FD|nr:GH25 family lysozyme [Listeria booriae]MBC1523722.1 hypothetical protein [Listeria booriae]MBC6150124.1 hypothetical protein [Listeria booriae]